MFSNSSRQIQFLFDWYAQPEQHDIRRVFDTSSALMLAISSNSCDGVAMFDIFVDNVSNCVGFAATLKKRLLQDRAKYGVDSMTVHIAPDVRDDVPHHCYLLVLFQGSLEADRAVVLFHHNKPHVMTYSNGRWHDSHKHANSAVTFSPRVHNGSPFPTEIQVCDDSKSTASIIHVRDITRTEHARMCAFTIRGNKFVMRERDYTHCYDKDLKVSKLDFNKRDHGSDFNMLTNVQRQNLGELTKFVRNHYPLM